MASDIINGKVIGDIGKSLYIKCDCSSHMLQIERYTEDDIDKGFYISTWKYGTHDRTFSFKEKIRWCWNIIKNGHPWNDELIISDDRAREISNFINFELKNEQ